MRKSSAIRVVLVDDHAIVRRSLRFGLLDAHDIQVVGEAADGEEALCVCRDLRPDVVLLDLRLPGMDSIAIIRALHRNEPMPQVLVHTADYDERVIPKALAAGACGYVLKGELAELLAAIRTAHACR
ncbi:MAG TPA: response regulator transcription factor [Ktedonobacterales bacterium]|nr:response regulator transcription factor [Ktedonobacterales bacterium]